jgi:subtilisin family serine protease
VIAVTAVDRRGVSYDSANHGDYIDVAAPGVDVRVALPDRQQGIVSGTSFAAPVVTALVAVSYNGTQLGAARSRSSLDPKSILLPQLRPRPVGGVRPDERDVVYGYGLVQAPAGRCGNGEAAVTAPKPSVAPADVLPLLGTWSTVVRAAFGG